MTHSRGTVPIIAAIVLSTLVPAVPSAGAGMTGPPAFAGTITVIADGSPGPMGPYPYSVGIFLNGPIEDSLVAVDGHFQYFADLASTVPSAANGGMRVVNGNEVVTIHFKPGQRWSDGSPITAADYIGSLLLGADPSAPHFNNCDSPVTSATASSTTLVLTFSGAFSPALDGCVPNPMPIEYFQRKYGVHLPDSLTASYDARAVTALYTSPSFRNSALRRLIDKWGQDPYESPSDLFSGPYKPIRYVQDRVEVLAANPYYSALPSTQGHPRPARIQFVLKATSELLAAATAPGAAEKYDLAGPFWHGAGPGLDLQATLTRVGYRAIPVLEDGVELLALNLASPALSDTRVRQALYYALDKVAYIRAILPSGMTTAQAMIMLQASPIPSDQTPWSINNVLPRNPYNPSRARALLAAAGYAARPTGAGKHLSLDFYTTENAERRASARILQTLWAPFGITLRMHFVQGGGSYGLLASYTDGGILARHHFDIAEFALGGYVEPDFLLQWFDPSQIPSESQPNGTNYSGVQNVRLLEYLTQARQSNVMKVRQQLYDQAQRLIIDNAYWIPLNAVLRFYGIRPTLGSFKAVERSPYGNAYAWYRTNAR